MFRIKMIFENKQTLLLKVEGEIAENNLDEWSNWLEFFTEQTKKQIILEFCDLIFASQKAVEKLLEKMTNNVYLLNCLTAVKNIAHSSGFSKNVLE